LFERATTIDESLVEIGRWASPLPGDFPVDAADRNDDITEVTVNGVLLSSGVQQTWESLRVKLVGTNLQHAARKNQGPVGQLA